MNRKRIYGVSQDAPTYFHTSRFTELQPLSPAVPSAMGCKSVLHTSVSSEAPEAFHIKYSSVVSPGTRKVFLSNPHSPTLSLAGARSLSETPHPSFQYEDLKQHQGVFLDQNTVKPTTLIDLLIGKNTSHTYKLPYYKEYLSALRGPGFAKHPGEFSQMASQRDLIRRDSRLLQKLQSSLNQSKASLIVEKKTEKGASLDITHDKSFPKTLRKSKSKVQSVEARSIIGEIQDFEARLAQELKLPSVFKTSKEKWQWKD